MVNSPVSASLITEAVKPAAEEAFPLVYTARGFSEQIYLYNRIRCTYVVLNRRRNLLQKLTFARGRISHDAYVDVATELHMFLLGPLSDSANQLKKEAFLDGLMAIYHGGE